MVVERSVPAGRQAVTVGEVLQKHLGGLDPGGGLTVAETGDAGGPERIGDTDLQRGFGAYHHKVRRDLFGKGDEARNVRHLYRPAFGQRRHARIARRADETRGQRRLSDLPHQGVFAPARADDQDVHGRHFAGVLPTVNQTGIVGA